MLQELLRCCWEMEQCRGKGKWWEIGELDWHQEFVRLIEELKGDPRRISKDV